jgi:hypothetical protein
VARSSVPVKASHVPDGSLAARAFPRIDYGDAYATPLPPNAPRDIDSFAHAFLLSAPGWVEGLMSLRDHCVAVVGLKTAGTRRVRNREAMRIEPGASFGIFRVLERSGDEILLGQDDRHLDFRVSLLIRHHPETSTAVISTVVRFHNRLGRAYFIPVRIFHRLIVPAMLRSTIRNLR